MSFILQSEFYGSDFKILEEYIYFCFLVVSKDSLLSFFEYFSIDKFPDSNLRYLSKIHSCQDKCCLKFTCRMNYVENRHNPNDFYNFII
ncbi:hypothetical protein BpHYR1_035084 [Brachionus plicatilis]|uniref:Uncharacterized protein n=1 Tax=Brachionus plicatilis TaxID=10195 RepID=A0A3M7SZ97_BRAPC|nr:hypothetical protein BpHYR1_035084 [Brachionus plicatilis]